MMNQKEAVYNATTSIVGKDFKEGMNCGEYFKARPELKEKLIASLTSSFESGQWEIKNKQENLKTYIIGVIANYFRKDIRLNGGTAYVPEKTGARGVSTPEIKALKQLLKTLTEGSKDFAAVSAAIASESEKVKASRATSTIDTENLPEEFRYLVVNK